MRALEAFEWPVLEPELERQGPPHAPVFIYRHEDLEAAAPSKSLARHRFEAVRWAEHTGLISRLPDSWSPTAPVQSQPDASPARLEVPSPPAQAGPTSMQRVHEWSQKQDTRLEFDYQGAQNEWSCALSVRWLEQRWQTHGEGGSKKEAKARACHKLLEAFQDLPALEQG